MNQPQTTTTGRYFTYFDPIDRLPEEGQALWADEANHQKMIDDAIEKARAAETLREI